MGTVEESQIGIEELTAMVEGQMAHQERNRLRERIVIAMIVLFIAVVVIISIGPNLWRD